MASVHEDSLKYSLTPEKDSAFYISLNTTIMLSNHLAVKYSPRHHCLPSLTPGPLRKLNDIYDICVLFQDQRVYTYKTVKKKKKSIPRGL